MAQGPLKKNVHPRKLTWIPKMMVWKRRLLLNIAIGPYVVSMFNFWRVNFTICPTKYVTPTSLKVSHWLSQWICIYIYIPSYHVLFSSHKNLTSGTRFNQNVFQVELVIQGGPRADPYKWSYNPYQWPKINGVTGVK